MSSEAAPYKEALEGLQQQLASGEVQLDVYTLQGDPKQGAVSMEKVRKETASVIVAFGTLATQTALAADERTPVISALVLTAEVFRHSGNATGITLELAADTQLEWMQKLLQNTHTVGVLYNPKENQVRIDAATRLAKDRGIKLLSVPVQTPQDLPAALEGPLRQVDVLWSIADSVVISPQTAQPILLFSFRNRIPLVGLSSTWVKAGALYSLDWDYGDIGRQAGELVQRILRGTKPADLPPASPRKLTYALNMKSAQQLGVDVPRALVQGARVVFE